MNCRKIEPLLSGACEAPLPERDRSAVQAHLRDCPACRRLYDQIRTDQAGLRQMAQQLPTREADVYGQALQQWTTERAGRSGTGLRRLFGPHAALGSAADIRQGWRVGPSTWGLSLVSAAAVLLLAAGLLSWQSHGSARRPPLPAIAGIPHAGPTLLPAPHAVSTERREAGHQLARSAADQPVTPDRRLTVIPSVPERKTALRHSRPAPPLSSQVIAAGDLAYVNRDPAAEIHQWVALQPGDWERIEARIRRTVQVRDDFITLPFPRLASASERQIARAVDGYKREAAIVDPRLSHEVTVALKATALSDLCAQLRSDTGISLAAGPSVADEKVTLLCEKMPLRDVMRQLSRPFGYTWLRTKSAVGVGYGVLGVGADKERLPSTPNTQHPTPNTEYRYELIQDLRSQLLEEELRNRDQNAALLDLDREMKQYQPYLNLSPDEALARAATAPPEEKKLLEYLAGKGWGPAQIYSRLTPADLAALRAGQKLSFNNAPGSGTQPLPPELAHGMITSLRDYRIVRHGDNWDGAPAKYLPDGLPPSAVPEAQPMVSLSLDRSELGQLTLHGFSGFYIGTPPDCLQLMGDDDRNLAVGISPTVRSPQNAIANAALARDPALQPHVTVQDFGFRVPSGRLDFGLPAKSKTLDGRTPLSDQSKIPNPKSKITTADVLEALHRATGLPIVADYYTRLYPAAQVEVRNTRLFDALNRLADTMRLRWSKDPDHGAGGWLQFRSADFYNDRLKEVPNRLLVRWAASRRRHGALTLDDLIEISQLTDAQLDASTMAEGARVLYGLEEWDMARRTELRANWHFLASLSPEQRQMAQSRSGLPVSRMSLAQQQQFVSLLPSQPQRLPSLEELSQASLQVEYTMPGDYQWTPPVRDAAPAERMQSSPRVREHTREAALLAAQQIDPQVTEAQISPMEVGLKLTFSLGGPQARFTPFVLHADMHNLIGTLPQPVAH